jgi:putative membrane protein
MDEPQPRHRIRPPRSPKDLGAQRTIMAADRTLMAWIRTALAMLSFGFTIYKILEEAQKLGKVPHDHTPGEVGLFLAAMGTASMVLGTWQYMMTLKELNALDAFRLARPVLVIAFLLSAAGVTMFVGIAMDRF